MGMNIKDERTETQWHGPMGTVVPEHMREKLTSYIDDGVPVGHFLTAVLENDLLEAVGRADSGNMLNLPAYVSFLYNHAPSGCWGSKERVQDWLRRKRDERPLTAKEA
jgi:hypothetical protein